MGKAGIPHCNIGKPQEFRLRMDKPYVVNMEGRVTFIDKLPHLWKEIEGHMDDRSNKFENPDVTSKLIDEVNQKKQIKIFARSTLKNKENQNTS